MASFLLFLDKSVGEETASILNEPPDVFAGANSWITMEKRIGIALEASGQGLLNSDPFFSDDKSGSCIVADSRLDYREELAGKLGINPNENEGFTDARLILSAYMKWGEACLSHLYGDFSFVLWDPGRDELFCARDHFGCRPLYYVDAPGFLALASQISAFRGLPGFRFEIREQYILDSICSILRTDSSTAYNGISRIKPAHHLKFAQGTLSGQHRYWDLKNKEDNRDLTLEEASRGLKERFNEAVRQRSRGAGSLGVELSGGLDSSGIASALTMLADKEIKINAFTHSVASGSKAPHTDQKTEMEYSTALVEKYGGLNHFEITEENSEGSYHALINALHILNKPINLHYALNSDLLFKAAGQTGTAIMFSGFGGDEGISFPGNGYFNELISKNQHAQLRKDIRSIVFRHGGGFYRHLIRCYINYYFPRALKLFQKDWRAEMFRSFAIQKDLSRKYRMKKSFFSSPSAPVKPDVRAMQYFRLMLPNIPQRIEETNLLAQAYGIQYRYPCLDVKLIEYFYALPSAYKYRNGLGRYLFRMAMKESLPEKIRMRTDKSGITIPNVFARTWKDEKIFRATIREGKLNNTYHYVDYNKLDQMLDILKDPAAFKEKNFDLKAFQSAMSVLILQQWQRDGKIDIGIKC